jgi:bifunctional UDP-N-acetylglucosamine pyrophosphorylase/glucosamine-1-phosphate N-acetyltransferase
MTNRNISRKIPKIEELLKKGVKIPNPHSIEIGDDVNPDRISGDGVVIYSGCKIYGNSTLILKGTKLGYEGPVTIENCQVGPEVDLKGGFFRGAVFLKKVSMGFGSHVREGTILEEEASVAHCVGLKQTILFPFVTLGSLINFCDCFMSGGTSRKDHGEVGSSYIHFNYTTNQDKATPSLIGNVPQGVMLNQKPIFLGGQGGLVGPCRLSFGTVIAAGTICRKDELRPDLLIFEQKSKNAEIPYIPGMYRTIKRTVLNNILYIANLIALMQWYTHARSMFIGNDFPPTLFEGLKEKLNTAIDERIKRLGEFCDKMPYSIDKYQEIVKEKAPSLLLYQKKELYEKWSELKKTFNDLRNIDAKTDLRDTFLEKISIGIKNSGKDYIPVIKGLEVEDTQIGTLWLQGIIDRITTKALEIIPSFDS